MPWPFSSPLSQSAPPPAVTPAPPAPFIAAATFHGQKKGYVFRKGPTGLGYYLDRSEQAKAVVAAELAAAPATPTQTPRQQRWEESDGGKKDRDMLCCVGGEFLVLLINRPNLAPDKRQHSRTVGLSI